MFSFLGEEVIISLKYNKSLGISASAPSGGSLQDAGAAG
jgi:hypothetical protein